MEEYMFGHVIGVTVFLVGLVGWIISPDED